MITDVQGTVRVQGHNRKCYKTLSEVGEHGRQTAQSDPTFERRFWSRVSKAGPVNPRRPELGPCWIWTGARYSDSSGLTYGQTSYCGQRMGAHRAAFLAAGGSIPPGLDVMHLCDTKACVRVSHLTVGTRSVNLLDANPANEGVCAGENNGRARLNWDDVHAIRAAVAGGASQKSQADLYGVVPVQISNIVRGARWPESKCPVHGTVAEAAA